MRLRKHTDGRHEKEREIPPGENTISIIKKILRVIVICAGSHMAVTAFAEVPGAVTHAARNGLMAIGEFKDTL